MGKLFVGRPNSGTFRGEAEGWNGRAASRLWSVLLLQYPRQNRPSSVSAVSPVLSAVLTTDSEDGGRWQTEEDGCGAVQWY